MKKLVPLACIAILAALICFFSFFHVGRSAPAAPAKAEAAFLVRFGLDDKADVDWSGSAAAVGGRLSGWQFNAGDRVAGNSWKCATESESYWDTPYEARMQPTSRRDKVTRKGILISFASAPPAEIRISTAQGEPGAIRTPSRAKRIITCASSKATGSSAGARRFGWSTGKL